MPVWTGPRDVVEDLVRIWRAVNPPDVGNPSRPDNLDDVYALAEMMAVAEGVTANWARGAVVSTADGAYLVYQARQVGLYPTADEPDATLRRRIQTPEEAITPDLVLSALQKIVDAAGGGDVYLIELPRDACYLTTPATGIRRAFLDSGRRMGDWHRHMVIALVPASANCAAAVLDSLRAKIPAGTDYRVETYTET